MDRTAKQTVKANFKKLIAAHQQNVNPADTITELVKAIGYTAAVKTVAELVNCTSVWDGRISCTSRQWAESVEEAATSKELEAAYIYAPSEIHPAHIDQIARAMQNYQPEQDEETVMIEAKFDNLKAYLIETEAATEEELENETAASTYNSGCETFEIIGNT